MDDYPVEAMRSSQITLRDKLGIIISTQYPNDNNVLLTEIDYAKKVLDGFIDDKRYFSLLYEPNVELISGDQWQTNDLIIYQSNPVACDYDYIFEDLVKKRRIAVLYDSKRENFLCKHCNIRYKSLGMYASGIAVESYVAKAGGTLDVTVVGLTAEEEKSYFGSTLLTDSNNLLVENKDDYVPPL